MSPHQGQALLQHGARQDRVLRRLPQHESAGHPLRHALPDGGGGQQPHRGPQLGSGGDGAVAEPALRGHLHLAAELPALHHPAPQPHRPQRLCIIYGMRRCRIGRSKSGRRHRITVMLIFVILIFLVCITPDAVMSTFFGMGYYEEAYLQRGIREITDLLLLVNSASNFVLYCIFNTIFWKNFVFLFCGRCYPNRTITEDSNMRRLSLVGRPVRSTQMRRGSRRTSKSCNGWNAGGSPLLDEVRQKNV